MKSSKNIVIIDYQMSNMFSIINALNYLNINCHISSNPKSILSSDGAILPGVGSFPEAMNQLRSLDLIETILKFISSGKPFMGICLGFQMLFSESSEFKNTKGLTVFEGKVLKFIDNKLTKKVPHVGWNSVNINNSLFGLNDYSNNFFQENENYYFVHSYYVFPQNNNIVLSTTNYNGLKFCSSILYENVFACQFHPEKSGYKGLDLFKSFFNFK